MKQFDLNLSTFVSIPTRSWGQYIGSYFYQPSYYVTAVTGNLITSDGKDLIVSYQLVLNDGSKVSLDIDLDLKEVRRMTEYLQNRQVYDFTAYINNYKNDIFNSTLIITNGNSIGNKKFNITIAINQSLLLALEHYIDLRQKGPKIN